MRLLLLVFLSVALAHAASITGKVVGIADGDTITILTPVKESVRVCLYGIDAPESKQAFGQRAKEELSSLVFGKEVIVDVKNKDRYGRIVGRVWATDYDVQFDINLELVRRGFAWWYRDYAKEDTELSKAEADAKAAKRGLWADKSPVPPWEFRRNESKAKAVPAR